MDTKTFRKKYNIYPSSWMAVLNQEFFPLHQTGRKRDDPELRRAVEAALDRFDQYAQGKKIYDPVILLKGFLREAALNVPPLRHDAQELPGMQAKQQEWEEQLGKRLKDPLR